ncbi:uncharacterized protein LOC111064296 isoform X2 [Nilaparvata lugens]|uniref:uncharacterized protein LOC111064296 isoform X2 n=1 Tax=Nilaparvata lugens TaxID=108931 RepID=UPI00193D4CF0|nr:uncharacterized protein LOC111064296 isoform X2 [Nilaparvata lugens]
MSNHFENLRELGKRIDEGIEHLENKLANPYSLGVVTSKSAALCEKTIEKLENEMKDLLENIEPFIKEETEDLEEIQGDIDAVNDFMKKLIDNINVMESRLRNKPDYVPFSMPIQDNFSPVSSVIDDCSVANTSILKDLTNSENLIGNESPNLLVSPNYISTPEPGSSCRRFSTSSRKPTNLTPFQKIWQKHNQSPDISHLSENMSRLDTPGNLSRNSNRSFLRNQPQLPKVPAMHNGGLKKKEIIESPKEPECSFQVFRRPHYQRNYNYN